MFLPFSEEVKQKKTWQTILMKQKNGDKMTIKAEPADNYDDLKRQFYALRNIVNSQSIQIQHYMQLSYSVGERHLAELRALLESEKAMNAQLTQELDGAKNALQESADH